MFKILKMSLLAIIGAFTILVGCDQESDYAARKINGGQADSAAKIETGGSSSADSKRGSTTEVVDVPVAPTPKVSTAYAIKLYQHIVGRDPTESERIKATREIGKTSTSHDRTTVVKKLFDKEDSVRKLAEDWQEKLYAGAKKNGPTSSETRIRQVTKKLRNKEDTVEIIREILIGNEFTEQSFLAEWVGSNPEALQVEGLPQATTAYIYVVSEYLFGTTPNEKRLKALKAMTDQEIGFDKAFDLMFEHTVEIGEYTVREAQLTSVARNYARYMGLNESLEMTKVNTYVVELASRYNNNTDFESNSVRIEILASDQFFQKFIN